MSATTEKAAAVPGDGQVVPADAVHINVDGIDVAVAKGTLVIRAAEQVGIQIPRFCDHPLLAPAGACRQCLVDIATPGPDGSMRPMPKPQASCTMEATEGMVVNTQLTSPVAAQAQRGVMELLLINHPLDCPVCDKGGECPLQNQAMSSGSATSRFADVKRTYPKPIRISTQILLDRERCVLCQRCTRFSDEIAGDRFIALQMRGAKEQIGTFSADVLGYQGSPLNVVSTNAGDRPVGPAMLDESGEPFASYFSGNTIQICPVGALTSAEYRFRSRPFDLVSTPGIAEHDSSGSAIRIDHRRGEVLRRLAGEDPVVNEEWITDKDRFAFNWQNSADRFTTPMVRDSETGDLRSASWTEALEVAAKGLIAARDANGVGVLTGGRLTLEDSYAYSKFARIVLGTNDIDMRSRVHSAEEAAFLGSSVAGRPIDVTFADLEKAKTVLLVDFEPEEEGGVVFLRLRKGVRAHGTKVYSIAALASCGLQRVDGTLIPAAPGREVELLEAMCGRPGGDELVTTVSSALSEGEAIILVGERAAGSRGTLAAATRLADRSGARLAWIPRRVGERGAVEVGVLPNLLPGGRPVEDAAARIDVAAVWGAPDLPATPGRDTDKIVEAAGSGELSALIVAGVDLDDLANPVAAAAALDNAAFLVSLEVRASEVSGRADVIFPVAPPVERPGTFMNWEGRLRPFAQALTSTALTDHRVLDALAGECGVIDSSIPTIGVRTMPEIHDELGQLSGWDGSRVNAPFAASNGVPYTNANQAVLATWRMLLDDGRGQIGEPFLNGTAKQPVARCSAATLERAKLTAGGSVRISTSAGSITLPLVVTDMVDQVIWIPSNSGVSKVNRYLGVGHGAVVTFVPAQGSENSGAGIGTDETAEAQQ